MSEVLNGFVMVDTSGELGADVIEQLSLLFSLWSALTTWVEGFNDSRLVVNTEAMGVLRRVVVTLVSTRELVKIAAAGSDGKPISDVLML
jgi:hypothetical protein